MATWTPPLRMNNNRCFDAQTLSSKLVKREAFPNPSFFPTEPFPIAARWRLRFFSIYAILGIDPRILRQAPERGSPKRKE